MAYNNYKNKPESECDIDVTISGKMSLNLLIDECTECLKVIYKTRELRMSDAKEYYFQAVIAGHVDQVKNFEDFIKNPYNSIQYDMPAHAQDLSKVKYNEKMMVNMDKFAKLVGIHGLNAFSRKEKRLKKIKEVAIFAARWLEASIKLNEDDRRSLNLFINKHAYNMIEEKFQNQLTTLFDKKGT